MDVCETYIAHASPNLKAWLHLTKIARLLSRTQAHAMDALTADNRPHHEVFLCFQYGGSKRHSDVTNQFVTAMFYKIALSHYDVDSKKCTAMDSRKRCHTIDGCFAIESRSKETQFSHTCR